MEFLTIFLSGLFALISPAGAIIDGTVENAIREEVEAVEVLEVRVDNVPSYQALQGKVDKIRIASRGLEPIAGVRIEVLELETDAISVDLNQLNEDFFSALRQPLQGGVRLVLTEADLNQAWQSETIQALIQEVLVNLNGGDSAQFQLLNPQIDLLGNNRLAIAVQLLRPNQETNPSPPLDIYIELEVTVINGRNLQISDLQGTIDGKTLSRRFLKGFSEGISERLDLAQLEDTGITARLLQLDITKDQVNIAVFVHLENKIEIAF